MQVSGWDTYCPAHGGRGAHMRDGFGAGAGQGAAGAAAKGPDRIPLSQLPVSLASASTAAAPGAEAGGHAPSQRGPLATQATGPGKESSRGKGKGAGASAREARETSPGHGPPRRSQHEPQHRPSSGGAPEPRPGRGEVRAGAAGCSVAGAAGSTDPRHGQPKAAASDGKLGPPAPAGRREGRVRAGGDSGAAGMGRGEVAAWFEDAGAHEDARLMEGCPGALTLQVRPRGALHM